MNRLQVLSFLTLTLWTQAFSHSANVASGSGFIDGAMCNSDVQCQSGRCAPGPEGTRSCVAIGMNCARPDFSGVSIGESYLRGGKAYLCNKSGSIMTQVDLPCSLSTNRVESIYRIWLKVLPQLRERVIPDSAYPSQLYYLQNNTANFLQMAGYCRNRTLLEELAGLYLIPHGHLRISKSGAKHWAAPGKDEVMLWSTQFIYPLAVMLRRISEISANSRSEQLKEFGNKYSGLLRDTLIRWIFEEKSMWTWPQCGLPPGVTDPQKAYTLSSYVLQKHQRKLRLAGNAPVYCNAIMEQELWAALAVTEYLNAGRNDPALAPLPEDMRARLMSYVRDAVRLFEDRITVAVSNSALCGGQCPYLEFDRNSWRGHPEYPDPIWGATETAWDISHARRLIPALETFYANPEIARPAKDGKLLKTLLSNALVYRMFNGNWNDPQFTNFINGANYRYRHYAPYGLSSSYFRAGYGFLWTSNADLMRINNAFVGKLREGKPLFDYHGTDSLSENLDALNFLSSTSAPIN